MVGYNPDVKLTDKDYVTAGAISNAVTRAVTQPFDVLKIRFQLQIEPLKKTSSSSKYHSIYQAARCIVREEGYKALWKGHVPAQFLSISYGVIQFTTFEHFTKSAWVLLPDRHAVELRPFIHLVCGGMAATAATMVIQPLDVLRTRFVAQGEPKVYKSFYHAAQCIAQKEGLRGFYKGLTPAILGTSPQMALNFGLYALLQNIWNSAFSFPKQHLPGAAESFICGSGSGFLSKLMIYPLDLVKKRLQIQGFEEARQPFGKVTKYSGLVHCFKKMIQEEGYLGLYKGLSPSLLKAVFVSGTMFCVYDQICFLLALKNR